MYYWFESVLRDVTVTFSPMTISDAQFFIARVATNNRDISLSLEVLILQQYTIYTVGVHSIKR